MKLNLDEFEKQYIKYDGDSKLEMKPIRVVKAIKRIMVRLSDNRPKNK